MFLNYLAPEDFCFQVESQIFKLRLVKVLKDYQSINNQRCDHRMVRRRLATGQTGCRGERATIAR